MQSKRKTKKKSPLIPIIIIVLLIIGAILIINGKRNSNYDGDSLIGTFLYEEGKTKYTFKEDGTGKMTSNSFKYDYKYKTEGEMLIIDFNDDTVHDATYSYELNDGILKLVSKEGTVSINQEYILKKENK